MTYPTSAFRSPCLAGMTLLEVLIACGILVIGLSSIASLLPAAGSRLGQAAVEDRAGTLAANARMDAFGRNMVAFDMFLEPSKAVVFGRGLTGLATLAPLHFAHPASVINQRIDPQRGFFLEDEVLFSPPTNSDMPGNDFPGGRRAFKEATCWGATLVPHTFPASLGGAAILSVPIFRKEPESRPEQLVGLTNKVRIPPSNQEVTLPAGLFAMSTPDESLMNRYLRSCSYVIASARPPASGTAGPPPGNDGPRWFRVRASWVMPRNPATGQRVDPNCYVVFDDADGKTITDFAGQTPTVIGFENIVRLDQYNVSLQ